VLAPQINVTKIAYAAFFDIYRHKKARFLIQQNLASEEGDEKLFDGLYWPLIF